ncbi:MAG: DUF4037 domain-containing protein [Spirochaetota bacterium]
MRIKVEGIAEKLGSVCAAWKGVDAVSLGELSEEDTLDPYFALSFDVFHTGELPAEDLRRLAFGDVGAFESSRIQAKDRFLIEGLPVRIEYKSSEEVASFSPSGRADLRQLLSSGTYPLYRLQNGRVLHDRSAWLASMRTKFAKLPDETWSGLREVLEARMEHCLTDLGASARMDDSFFYLESSAGFAKQTASLLFAINQKYEPSHRSIEQRLRELQQVPDDFFGRWEIFLRSDIGMSREQKYEVASLIAKSVLTIR